MDLRSGGLGTGNKEAPVYAPPQEWKPSVITSNIQGVTIVIFDAESSTLEQLTEHNTIPEPSTYIPPETNL